MVQRLIQIVADNCYDEGFVLCEEEADKILTEIEKHMTPLKRKVKDPGHFPGDQFEYEAEGWEEE